MTYIIALPMILLGYILFFLSIGHLILVIRIGVPATNTLKKLGIIKNNIYLFSVLTGLIILISTVVIFTIFFINYLIYLTIGFILSILMIIINFKKRYTFNKDSFNNWYLKDNVEELNFDNAPKELGQDKDVLFEIVNNHLKK